MLSKAKGTTESKPPADELKPLREQLLALLRGGQAHVSFDDAVAGFPEEQRGIVPKGLEHSAWQILEHIRIAQRAIQIGREACRERV